MATRARFGRLPRSAPSLTSTIVALAQQYQGQRDRNIEGAWKNGGLFEGKKVTDKMFLDHWQKRLGEVSQDDPMWDYYNNLIQTYEFTIEESKMGQKYAEEKVSEGQMASFYRSWAKKLPHDSEAYRQLMTQAAKFKAAAASRARGSGAQAAQAAYAKAQNATFDKHEKAYSIMTSRIAGYALVNGYIDQADYNDPDYGWSKLTNASGENDPANFAALLVDLTNDPAAKEAITAEIRQWDPSFSGEFNEQTFGEKAKEARNGAATRYERARKAGRVEDANDAKKSMDNYSLQDTITSVALAGNPGESFIAQNEFYRARLDAVFAENSGASPMQKRTAKNEYTQWLTGQGGTAFLNSLPPGSIDPLSDNFNPVAAGMWGAISNTVNAMNGKATGQTLKDDLFGFDTGEAGKESDAVKLQDLMLDNEFELDNVASGNAIVVRTNGKGVPTPNGSAYQVFARDAPEVADNQFLVPIPSSSADTYTAPDGTKVGGASGELRYEVAVPIKVRAYQYQDPQTGVLTGEVKPYEGNDEIVGMQLTIRGAGGAEVTTYGTYVNGRLLWSPNNPMRQTPGMTQTTDPKDGSVVYNYTSGMAPLAGPAAKGQPKPGFVPQDFVDKSGLMTPDTKPGWNPATDKQTAWDSPLASLANASSEHLEFVAGMGNEQVAVAERAWYSNKARWTPEMNQQFNQALVGGMNPQDAFGVIVNRKSNTLISELNFARQYGFTPEQQQATRKAMASRFEQEAAAREGMTVPQYNELQRQREETAVRDDLIEQLGDWGIDSGKRRTPDMFTVGGFVAGQEVETGIGLPKGWTASDLLTQPGMTLAAASDLANRISGGAVGTKQSWGSTPYTQQPGSFPGAPKITTYHPSQTPGNPFMPKAGTTGTSWQLGPANASQPRIGPSGSIYGAPTGVTVNPYTGFTVPNVKPQPKPAPLPNPSTDINKAPTVKGYKPAPIRGGTDWGYQKEPGGRIIY